MDKQLHRILAFAQTTGDKVIITDKEGKEPMVVMPFDMYEHLIQVGRQGADVSGAIDSLEGMPDEHFAPDEPLTDDLELEEEVVPVAEKKPAPVPKREEKGGDLPSEEQYYLEPVE